MPCAAAKPAIVVYGKQLGRKLTVCTDKHCPVHHPQAVAVAAADPVPTITPAPEIETEEETTQREAEHERRMGEYKAEQERKFLGQRTWVCYGCDKGFQGFLGVRWVAVRAS
jgi:ParB family chromosome partitioning protein